MSRIQHTPTVVEPATPVIEPVSTPQPEPVAQANAVEVRLTSAQLKERLDETRAAAERRVLAELGIDDAAYAALLAAGAVCEDPPPAQGKSS